MTWPGKAPGTPGVILNLICRWTLGLIFIYAGAIKVVDPQGFALAINNYHILPAALIHPAAIVLPWVEIVAGASLILGLGTLGGALIISGLLLIFGGALCSALLRGIDLACGCFSTAAGAGRVTWTYLLRDAALLAMALLVLCRDNSRAIAGRTRSARRGLRRG